MEIQTEWTEFRPNSDKYWANGLNSDRLRKIRPEWQQCILKRRKESSIEKQRHLLSAKKSTSNTVAKLINAFEHNSTNCDVISQNKTKISELDLSCINKGSVKDAFALLMLRKGVDLTPKTPRRKNVKRLDKEKTTSDQKRIDAWMRK